jgi:hypothetical protein
LADDDEHAEFIKRLEKQFAGERWLDAYTQMQNPTKAVGVRRQAERGADGHRAVDRLGRAVGVLGSVTSKATCAGSASSAR